MAVLRRCRHAVLAAMVVAAGCAVSPDSREQRPQPQPGPGHSMPLPAPAPQQPAAPVTPPVLGGSYADRLEGALRQQLMNMPVRIQRGGEIVKVVVPVGAAFSANGDQFQQRFVASLDALAAVLREYARTSIEIRSYTDSTGSFVHNQQLSERRAQNLAGFLSARQVASSRIHATGFGPRNPVADNRTDSGRIQNRRIEIELVPLP